MSLWGGLHKEMPLNFIGNFRGWATPVGTVPVLIHPCTRSPVVSHPVNLLFNPGPPPLALPLVLGDRLGRDLGARERLPGSYM